jgi:hypothetical protein
MPRKRKTRKTSTRFGSKVVSFNLRMPEKLRADLEREAAGNNHSMNAEIVERLIDHITTAQGRSTRPAKTAQGRSAQYAEFAARSLALARMTVDSQTRVQMLQIAQAWSHLAEHATPRRNPIEHQRHRTRRNARR